MEMIRYQLANVTIPPNTPPDDVLFELYADLKAQIESTPNMGTKRVGLFGNVIRIPASTTQWIPLDADGARAFRATITDTNGQIVVKVVGRHAAGNLARAVQMDYKRVDVPNTLYDYALAARGRVDIVKGEITGATNPEIATVMSAKDVAGAITMSGGAVGGRLRHVVDGSVVVTGGTVHQTGSISEIYEKYVDESDPPEFPTIDTDAYRHYATNAWNAAHTSGGTMSNVRIPANTNPTFTGGVTIQGILFVEAPNTLTFRGNVNLNGFIVMDADAPSAIDVRGNVTHGALPSGNQFDPFRTITFASILGPTTDLAISGSTSVTFGGNVIINALDWSGAAQVIIDQGTIVAMKQDGVAARLNGSKSIKITGTGKDRQPTVGFSYSQYFKAIGGTYRELQP
jgi:hypothetical protein